MNIIPNKTPQLPYMTPGDRIQIYSTFHGVQSNLMGNLKVEDYINNISIIIDTYYINLIIHVPIEPHICLWISINEFFNINVMISTYSSGLKSKLIIGSSIIIHAIILIPFSYNEY